MLDLKLAEMLCARFSHDIIGPIGALSNGAEFLREELGSKESVAADLIESSSKEAVARVQYYRQAYGYLSSANANSIGEFKELAQKYFAASKVKLEWALNADSIMSAQKKLALNLLIVASSMLLRGGIVKISDNDGKFTITASGDKVGLQPPFRKCLLGELPENEIDARLIQCHYTHLIGKENSLPIEIHEESGSLTFSFPL